MIPNRGYPILEARALRRWPLGVRRFGESLVLWRDASGAPVCMIDRCPHRGAALRAGRVLDGELECPWHGFRFAPDGACTRIPCSGRDARIPRAMRTAPLPVRERYGLLWLWWGEARGALPELPWFDALPDDRSAASGLGFEAPFPWERMIEANLDVHHTPFLHRRSIPGVPTRMDPLHVEVEGDTVRGWGELRRDDEGASRRPRGFAYRLEARLPNLVLLEFASRLRLLVAATPVDEARTWIFGRYSQGYTRVPLLRKLLAWVSIQYDWRVVQRDDWRLFETLREARFDPHDFRLVPADRAIVEFFRLIERARAEAGGSGDRRGEARESA
jgi:phenylpropionate dioxygenase-like ring-hydroxylating dioxygenase large terminal subunit